MAVDTKILTLRLAILIEKSSKKRLTISDKRLKDLAETKLLGIRYLSNLKDELEKLGYFIGNLPEGGFGLLVINSLEGAFPLIVSLGDDIFTLNEQQLSKELSSLSLQKNQKRAKDTTITKEDICSLLWMGLADLANKKQTIFYGDLAKELILKNTHHNAFKRPLDLIAKFCKEKTLPLLSYLVVRQDTSLPPLMMPQDKNIQQYQEELKKITAVNWNEHQASFEMFVKVKNK